MYRWMRILVTIGNGSGKPACLIRCKYPVGADGAHSTVRKRVGIAMEGDSTDHVWGVIDFVTDTEFPDIRRLTTVQNRFGMAMGIPREKNAQGEWRTRFYADMNDLEVKRRQVVHDIHDTNETVLVENRSRLTTFTSA
ncbi:aminotransferase class 3 [Venturia nashicola]|nr:aminotransferase class 3 [Venturia nashicola]